MDKDSILKIKSAHESIIHSCFWQGSTDDWLIAIGTVGAVWVSLWLSRRGERFAKEQLRLQLLDQRLKIWDVLFEFGKNHHGGIPDYGENDKDRLKLKLEEMKNILDKIDFIKVRSLFGEDIETKIRKSLLEPLIACILALESRNIDENYIDQINKHIYLINNTTNALPDIIKPYVDFSAYKGGSLRA